MLIKSFGGNVWCKPCGFFQLSNQETTMDEKAVRGLIEQVRENAITRKDFIRNMIGYGLTCTLPLNVLNSIRVML
jgi:hypothetical protein